MTTEAAAPEAPAVVETPIAPAPGQSARDAVANAAAQSEAERTARNIDLMARHVNAAKVALLAEDSGQTPAPATETREPSSSATSPERGPDGKFLPRGQKPEAHAAAPAAKPEKAEPEKADPAKPAEPAGTVTIANVRALLDKDPDAAFKLAFGKDPAELKISSKAWEDWRHATTKSKRELSAKEQTLRSEATQLVQAYEPMVRAVEAWKAGDAAAFIKHATGLDVTDFQNVVLKGVVNRNPQISALEKRIADQEQMIRGWQERQAKDAADARQSEEIATFKGQLAAQLGTSAEYARHAKGAGFIDEVFQELDAHSVSATESTLSPEEAAAIVLARARARYGFDEGDGQAAGVRGASPVAQQKGRPITAAKPGARSASMTLDPTAATEATGPRVIRDKQKLMESYIEKAKSRQLAG